MSNSGDINSLWTSIRSSNNVQEGLLECIQKTLSEKDSSEKESPTKSGRKTSKRVAEKRHTSRVFGNPMRNVSDNLVQLYNKNPKYKKAISPVLEKLGYNKKQKKFIKWPILLKDFIFNLHQEIVNESNGGKLAEDGKEKKEPVRRSKRSKTRSEIKVRSEGQISESAKAADLKVKSDQVLSKVKEEVIAPSDKEMKSEPVKREALDLKLDPQSPIRNLHSPEVKKEGHRSRIKIEESKQSDMEMKDEEHALDCNIDMNCNEVLSELDN